MSTFLCNFRRYVLENLDDRTINAFKTLQVKVKLTLCMPSFFKGLIPWSKA